MTPRRWNGFFALLCLPLLAAGCSGPAAPVGPGIPGTPPAAPRGPRVLVPTGPKEAYALVMVDLEALRANADLKPLIDAAIRSNDELSKDFDPQTVVEAQMSFCAATPEERAPVSPFFVIAFDDAEQPKKLIGTFRTLVPAEHAGKKYQRGANPLDPSVYQPDPQTVIISTDRLMKSYLENSSPPKEFVEAISRPGMKGQVRLVALPGTQKELAAQLAKNPALALFPQAKRLAELPNHVTLVALSLHVAGEEFLHLELDAAGGDSPKEVKERIDGGLTLARDLVNETLLPQFEKPEAPPALKTLGKPIIEESLGKLKVEVQGDRVVVSLPVSAELAKLSRQAVPAIVKQMDDTQLAMETFRQQNYLRQVWLGGMNHANSLGGFPVDFGAAEGKPTLSWRVAVLAYTNESELLAKFDPTLPWDAAPNRAAAAQMPGMFADRSGPPGKGTAIPTTRIFRFVGPGTLFEEGKKAALDEIKDGAPNTILYVQAGPSKAVPWTQPADLKFDPKNPIAALGDIPPTGFVAVFCDGSAQVIPATIRPEVLAALITPAGGEPVDRSQLAAPAR